MRIFYVIMKSTNKNLQRRISLNNDYSDRFCVVIQQTVSEMECYETVMGSFDTIIRTKTIMISEQIR